MSHCQHHENTHRPSIPDGTVSSPFKVFNFSLSYNNVFDFNQMAKQVKPIPHPSLHLVWKPNRVNRDIVFTPVVENHRIFASYEGYFNVVMITYNQWLWDISISVLNGRNLLRIVIIRKSFLTFPTHGGRHIVQSYRITTFETGFQTRPVTSMRQSAVTMVAMTTIPPNWFNQTLFPTGTLVRSTATQETNMIPPNASLVKYDNPVLVSRNTDKKTPRVSVFVLLVSISLISLRKKIYTLQPVLLILYCK